MLNENQNRPIILAVDDNAHNLIMLTDLLENMPYRILIADSGEDAIIKAELAKPDLILLDILMPDGIDGFETCKRLKDNPKTKDIPVIFTTAVTDVKHKSDGFKLGAVDYITKPFHSEELIARINKELLIQKQKKLLEEQNSELQKLNAAKDKFLSIIAHDLKSPFNSLISGTLFIEQSYEKFEKDELKKMLRELHKSSTKVYELLGNLLQWSCCNTGSMEIKPESIEIDLLVDYAISIFEQTAKNKQISIKSMVPVDSFVYSDIKMTDTILRNLLGNAVKFTPKGGEIVVSGGQKDNFVEIIVSDTGIGMSEADINQLFKIESKFSSLGTEGESGTGLGLILCKEFIERNGGKIHVESQINKGSRFYFTLPKPPS